MIEGYLSYRDIPLTKAAEEEMKLEQRNSRIRKKNLYARQKHQMKFDVKQVVVLGSLVLIMLYMGASYICIQSSCRARLKNIQKLQQNVELLKRVNDELETNIEAHTANLKEIYHIATTELGMTYPNAEQMIPYQSIEKEYVEQGNNIPVLVYMK